MRARVGLLSMVAFYFTRRHRLRRRLQRQFTRRARELHLKKAEIEQLAVVAYKMNQPASLLDSITIFDRVVGPHADALAAADLEDPKLLVLASARKTLGFERLPPEQTLHSTRQIEAGQTLHLRPAGDADAEVDSWVVVECREGFLVAAPLLTENLEKPAPFKPDQALEVRFWREEGIEYRFESKPLPGPSATPQLYLAHANEIDHVQQRGFFRLRVDFPLLLLGVDEPLDDEEKPPSDAPTLRTEATDISGGGLGLVALEAVPSCRYFVVDPRFAGEFPIAGLSCRLVRQAPSARGPHLQLQFRSMPPGRESQLVRRIQQRQLNDRSHAQDSSSASS